MVKKDPNPNLKETSPHQPQDLADQLKYFKQKYRESTILNDALISSIGDGMIIVNEYGYITRVNQAALDILGYEKGDLDGKWLPRVLPAKDKDGLDIPSDQRPIVEALVTGKPTSEITSYVKKSGQLIPVAGTAAPFMILGKPKGGIIVFRDFSLERNVERAKDEFISLASHQLQTPLSVVRFYLGILKDEPEHLSQDAVDHLDKIQSAVDKMLNLVSDFLNISKLELGELDLNLAPIRVEDLIREQISEISPLLAEKNIKLSFKEPPGKVPRLKADAEMLRQVIHNLLTNAVRYTQKSKGKIDVALKTKKDSYSIAVADNGIGIPDDAKERVFQRLYRADNAIEAQSHGTGLGLYLAKKIIEALEGEISFTSSEGKGSTFTVVLPR